MSNYTTPFQQLPFIVTRPVKHEGQGQTPKHRINSKVSFLRQRYAELDLFQQQVGQTKAGLLHQPYTAQKKTTQIYRSIFAAFTIIFATLGVTAMAVPLKFILGFFSSFAVIKGIVISLCFLFSLGSFSLAMTLRPEREAVLHAARSAKRLLTVIYGRKKSRQQITFLSYFSSNKAVAIALKNSYEEAHDKINSKKEDSLHLVHRIVTAKTVSKEEKEVLLNQAVEELQEALLSMTHSFRTL